MTINANSPTSTSQQYRWWEEDTTRIASALNGAAQSIERMSWHRRVLNMVCTRYFTGRELSSMYAYSMVKRPSSISRRLADVEWSPPKDNVIATIGDVYRARVWKNHPFILVNSIAGNFKAYIKARYMSRYIDAVFAETDFWDTFEWCGDDACTTGDGFVKVHENPTQKGKIAISRVFGDELLINEEEANYGKTRSLIQRCFMHKEELIVRYGKTPELRDAIWKAPGVYPGLYAGEMGNAQDIVPYLEGYHLKGWDSQTDKPIEGRITIVVGNAVLNPDNQVWKYDHFPFAQLKFSRLPAGKFGQGLVEKLLPYQAELNRYDEADWENQRRISWPRVMRPIGSSASTASLLGASGAIIDYVPVQGRAPEFIFPKATDETAEARRARIKDSAYLRARINVNAARGTTPEGLNSGAAIMAWATVDDSAHVDVGQQAEKFVTDVGRLVMELAEEIQPSVKLPGTQLQEIKWDDVKLASDFYHARAFPMSMLPQLPAARQQKIDNWYANGEITKAIKRRLEGVPDTEGYQDLANAALDEIYMTIDGIIETGDYMPPEPFEDLQQAIQIAQSRWLQEKTRKIVPQDRLDLLLTWIMQCDELIAEGAGPVGIQSPQGAPAAPPQQVAAAQGQPQQLPQAA